MEFRLPEELANKLVDYDQTLKQIKPRRESKEEATRLKRKTKLSFPCPEIFFDLSMEQTCEIHEEFCHWPIPKRHYTVRSNANPMKVKYHIAWEKDKNRQIEVWYCWKLNTDDCPVIFRYWDQSFEDDEYSEFRADNSLSDYFTTVNNPFVIRYKAERERHGAFSSFLASVNTQLNLPPVSRTVNANTRLEMYSMVKFFYERFYNFKDEQSFHPAKWLSEKRMHAMTERGLDLKTNSTIINSKFYQNEVRKDAKRLEELLGKERISTDCIIHKFSYIYLFLTVFPNEYDRSIYLYNQLSEYQFSSYWSTWAIFDKFEYIGEQLGQQFLDWLRAKLTPQMFANWILEEIQIKQRRDHDSTIRDTMEMLIKVWQRTLYLTNPNPEYLKEPKRWRLQEVHDHYVGITLQMDNQMKNLPMDLISSPVTFETEVGTIRMFQPGTNHEVIRWGKAVRNCVGSAGYDERVLQRKAFLVFAERDGKPWLTSLLTLNMGLLNVGQTVSPFNASLEPGERQVYERCLQQAIGVA